MEDGLERVFHDGDTIEVPFVLILVLMEDGLEHKIFIHIY